MLKNWKARRRQPVDVAPSAPTIGSSMLMPTATRLLSPRKGTVLVFGAPGFKINCAQPCLAASKPKRQRDHRHHQAEFRCGRDQNGQQIADHDRLRELLPVADE